ncbi:MULTISPECIES: cysteine desulfurase family protein [Thermodesulfovibrio]|jgi:cysteine desulfurase|uniref:cysteine desulfurase family protein n=1 Tax=Thermodesulfovibrio TaxID=28261 RepID=UPI00261C4C63|nr:cysteine desulfurase family protein [Thermodesulfovibrio sp.]
MIYLDYNATTPIEPRVKEEMIRILDEFGNPSSAHKFGRKARQLVEESRYKVAKLLGAQPQEIVFTSGGTESNNLAIFGRALCFERGHIITSCIEHPATLNPCRQLQRMGYDVTYLPVNSQGVLDPDDLRRAIRKDTILVSIMHSNNETGVLQPIKEIGEILREREIPFHTDCAQSIGKIPVSVSELNVTMVSLAGHKFYAPKGIGALYVKEGFIIKPIMFGGGHERGVRPGTENVPYIAAFAKACEIINCEFDEIEKHLRAITDIIWERLSRIERVKLNGQGTPRLPNTLNISISDIKAEQFVKRLDGRIAISAGSACHSGVEKPSHVLVAMGLTEKEALSSIRISTGKFNTVEEIKEASEIIEEEIKNSF